MHWDAFDLDNMDAELGYFVPEMTGTSLALSEELVLTERLLPPVDAMACVILIGGPTRYPAAFTAVGEWSEENGYELLQPQREIFLEVPADGNQDGMVIELQFPVTQLDTSPDDLLSTFT